ncbi:MAG: T9SS type A sorting domain-containing protein [Bacteroidia bacterium]
MKKIYTRSLFTICLLACMFSGISGRAQCGIPPSASNGQNWIVCNGTSTNVILNLGLLGGPYNIQYAIDYMFPGSPMAPISMNDPGPTYTMTSLSAAPYKIYIIDIAHGNCYDSVMFTITNDLPNLSHSFVNGSTCADQAQGGFSFAGTPPYSLYYTNDGTNFNLLTSTSGTTYNTSLNLGSYAYKMVDGSGCIVDQTNTALGYTAVDQSHWYIGLCGVTDSSVSYLTGGNQSLSRSVLPMMQGIGTFTTAIGVKVDFGDNTAQTYTATVGNFTGPYTFNHTYTTTGVYKITYTAFNSTLADSVYVVEFINNNSDVYPGDANGDGIANNYDLLTLGQTFGASGVTRPGASSAWTAQACTDWTQSFSSGLNYKHSDCDGNGLVDFPDTTDILLNYGQTHVLKMMAPQLMTNPGDPTLSIDFPAGNYSIGTAVTIPVNLGTASVPAANIYGLAFTVNYPSSAVDASNVNVDFSNSWMGAVGSGSVAIRKNFSASSSVDVAISRTDQQNITGNGLLCELKIITIDNVSGKMMSPSTGYFTFSNVTVIDKDGNVITVNTQKDSITIAGSNGIADYVKSSALKVYPNPAKETINIVSENSMEEIELIDISGRVITKVKPEGLNARILTEAIEGGFYFLRIRSVRGIENRSIEVIK